MRISRRSKRDYLKNEMFIENEKKYQNCSLGELVSL
jgi:hypothetical protein